MVECCAREVGLFQNYKPHDLTGILFQRFENRQYSLEDSDLFKFQMIEPCLLYELDNSIVLTLTFKQFMNLSACRLLSV